MTFLDPWTPFIVKIYYNLSLRKHFYVYNSDNLGQNIGKINIW